MKERHIYLKQIFEGEPTTEQGGEPPKSDTQSKGGEPKDKEAPKADEPPKGGEKKYTDADVDEIVKERLAREKANQQKKVDEAKKLGEMTAQQRAEYERDQLKEELDALKKSNARSEMASEARKMLSEENINIPDNLVNMIITTEAESTKENVDSFTKVFKAAVQDAVKDALKGKTPTTGGKSTITKAEILKVKDRNERQRLISEHIELFR